MVSGFSVSGKLLTFETSDRRLLNGFLFSGRKSKKVVLHVPGMQSNFYNDRNFPAMAKELDKAGYNFLPFNNRGHDVVVDIPIKNSYWKVGGTAYENFEDCLIDIKAAVDFAWSLGFREIILSGHSTGCQKIAYYKIKTKDKRVKGLILLAPADDYNSLRKELGENFEKAMKLAKTKTNMKELLPRDLLKGYLFTVERFLSAHERGNVESELFNYQTDMKLFQKIKCPILAVFGSNDEYRVGPVKDHLKKLEEVTKSVDLQTVIVKKGDHSFLKKHKDLATEISKWLRSTKF